MAGTKKRRGTTGALPESQTRTNYRQYNRHQHSEITSTKAKAIRAQLPDNMPRPLRRALAKSIAMLEKLAAAGKHPPGIQLDYPNTEGGELRFVYVPGNIADAIAEELLHYATEGKVRA